MVYLFTIFPIFHTIPTPCTVKQPHNSNDMNDGGKGGGQLVLRIYLCTYHAPSLPFKWLYLPKITNLFGIIVSIGGSYEKK